MNYELSTDNGKTIDLTKPIELVRGDGKTHEAIAVQLPDDTLIRRKTAATPFYWRWTGSELRLLDGRPQNVWTIRPLSPRPSIGADYVKAEREKRKPAAPAVDWKARAEYFRKMQGSCGGDVESALCDIAEKICEEIAKGARK